MTLSQSFRTVDIERRGYGRRYTSLMVDALSRDEFMIECAGGYITPEMIDVRQDDIVRWRDGERYVQALVAGVVRDGTRLIVTLVGAQPLPPETFFS